MDAQQDKDRHFIVTGIRRMNSKRRFVILDRDGTLIREYGYLRDPRKVELLPGVVVGLRRMQRMGLGLVVITNQSGVGRGYFTEKILARIHHRMVSLLSAHGIELDGIYHCPHTPEARCTCRKPRLGMLRQAAHDLGFVMCRSIIIGDKECDIRLGRNAGATSILVRTGYGAEIEKDAGLMRRLRHDAIVDDLGKAAEWIQRLVQVPEQRGRYATK